MIAIGFLLGVATTLSVLAFSVRARNAFLETLYRLIRRAVRARNG